MSEATDSTTPASAENAPTEGVVTVGKGAVEIGPIVEPRKATTPPVDVFMGELTAADLETRLNAGWEKWHAEFKGSKLYVAMTRNKSTEAQPQPQPAAEAPIELVAAIAPAPAEPEKIVATIPWHATFEGGAISYQTSPGA